MKKTVIAVLAALVLVSCTACASTSAAVSPTALDGFGALPAAKITPSMILCPFSCPTPGRRRVAMTMSSSRLAMLAFGIEARAWNTEADFMKSAAACF